MYPVFEHYLLGKRIYTKTLLPICEKHGLTYAELSILLFLANNPQLDTASNVVKFRGLAKSHVSVSVCALEERGLLKKEARNGNRKTLHLMPTAAAEKIIEDGRAAQLQFGELLLEGVSVDEKKRFLSVLEQIDRNVRKSANGGKNE